MSGEPRTQKSRRRGLTLTLYKDLQTVRRDLMLRRSSLFPEGNHVILLMTQREPITTYKLDILESIDFDPQMSSLTVLYEISGDGKVAYLTLNRPERLNAINEELSHALRAAVRRANKDAHVHVIVLKGAGKGFCGGYDLTESAEEAKRGFTDGSQDIACGYDPLIDYAFMKENTE